MSGHVRTCPDMSDRQKIILQSIASEKSLTKQEIMVKINASVTDRTLRRDLSSLKNMGLVMSTSDGQWCLTTQEDKSPESIEKEFEPIS